MSPVARREVEDLFADEEPDERSIARVVGIVGENGGLEYARRRGEQFAADAEAALEGLPDTAAVGALHDAVTYALDRSS